VSQLKRLAAGDRDDPNLSLADVRHLRSVRSQRQFRLRFVRRSQNLRRASIT
jgi:hypothetical protein